MWLHKTFHLLIVMYVKLFEKLRKKNCLLILIHFPLINLNTFTFQFYQAIICVLVDAPALKDLEQRIDEQKEDKSKKG